MLREHIIIALLYVQKDSINFFFRDHVINNNHFQFVMVTSLCCSVLSNFHTVHTTLWLLLSILYEVTNKMVYDDFIRWSSFKGFWQYHMQVITSFSGSFFSSYHEEPPLIACNKCST